MALPSTLQVHPHFQPEEAAHAAAELVSSLDNLPGEVVFLLEEIREKDVRINQLIQRINTRHIGLTKTAKQSSNLPSSIAQFNLPLGQGINNLPIEHLNIKDQQNLIKIKNEWIKVELLQDEKIKLSERIERLLNRAKERAKFEWLKIGGKEILDKDIPSLLSSSSSINLNINGEIKPNLSSLQGINGLNELGHNDLILPSTGLGTGSDGRPQKKRKPNTISIASPSSSIASSLAMPPPPAPIRPSISSRSNTSTSNKLQINSRHSSVTALTDPDADGEDIDLDLLDAEGEIDNLIENGNENENETGENENENETDDTIYCICQQRSYGEMIGCDNESCEYEWFHVKCVDISGPLPDTWYCPDCVKKLGMISSDGKMAGSSRKGRKK
ncbi:uncharacterized protein L201_003452 [Kwoniella dendrophila CBS 6074]|uniref:Chromatin modification-related protein n=1 Tax=Kwoniella dendrophila CBS 6074 TaxID=1295534 RepID=A0AAX4JSZ8_9TREE